ncbi:hypothetical protein Y032_0522g2888 [Ancylostoma ceylanicum]|uniref:Uncharacterized protein n=1 Tax=Ancylostoma ceylanicum TaxID=53326 RepID=A0A016WSS6_9BILA|nr:hypothetical protein Y032_0522g2888 [Ancylostoma ceylanicum]
MWRHALVAHMRPAPDPNPHCTVSTTKSNNHYALTTTVKNLLIAGWRLEQTMFMKPQILMHVNVIKTLHVSHTSARQHLLLVS